MVGLPGADLKDSELRQEVLTLQRRVQKLAALLRLALVVRPRGERWLTGERLPDGPAKARMLRAVDRARTCLPLRGSLRFLWYIDTTVIRLLDGTRAYVPASSTTSRDGFWRGMWPVRSPQATASPSSSRRRSA